MPLNPIERVELFKNVLGLGKGVEVLEEICRLFGVDGDTFHTDPYQHAYNAGQRAAAIKIKQIVNTDPERIKAAKDAEQRVRDAEAKEARKTE